MLKWLKQDSTTNAIKIVTNLIALIGIGTAAYAFLHQKPAAGPGQVQSSTWTTTDTYFVTLIGLNSVFYLLTALLSKSFYRRRARDREVIMKLCALQESYILNPHYVTTSTHGTNSKESILSKAGTANILTNSLKYDIIYADSIAVNIVRGAKYIYILPHTSSALNDLRDYILTISESIQKALQSQGVNGALTKLDELRMVGLEFWFFDNEHPCLYNFAIFHQPAERGSQRFVQCWWYINPAESNHDSHMLSYEITSPKEQSELANVFSKLKRDSHSKSGKEVYDSRENLSALIGGKDS